VDHAQAAEAHVPRVVVVGEGEGVPAVEPVDLGVAAVVRLSRDDHRFLLKAGGQYGSAQRRRKGGEETRVSSQESGVRSQESGVRSQQSEAGSQNRDTTPSAFLRPTAGAQIPAPDSFTPDSFTPDS